MAVHVIAMLYVYSMSPEKMELIRSRIVPWMELWEHWASVDGAKTSMSRWKRSHQNGVESMEWV